MLDPRVIQERGRQRDPILVIHRKILGGRQELANTMTRHLIGDMSHLEILLKRHPEIERVEREAPFQSMDRHKCSLGPGGQGFSKPRRHRKPPLLIHGTWKGASKREFDDVQIRSPRSTDLGRRILNPPH